MFIILEGPDCVGKSTLAQRIIARRYATHHGCMTLTKAGPLPADVHPLDAYVNPILDNGDGDLICDRWHVGEAVYPYVVQRPTRMTMGVLNWIELFLKSRGATTIVLDELTATLMRRFRERGDAFVDGAQLLDAARRFREITPLLLTRVEVDPDNVDSIVEFACGRRQTAKNAREFITHIGSQFPDVLLLGDTRNCDGQTCTHEPRHRDDGPAFMPYPGTSGEYLMNALGPLPRGLAIANACDVDDPYQMWWSLGCPPVVALGMRAHLQLKSNNIPHAAVPHPQYIRRFHHHSHQAYGHLIHEIIGTERDECQWRPSEEHTVGMSTPKSSAPS